MPRIASRPTRLTRAKNGDQPKASIEDRLLEAMERLLEQGQRFAALSVEQLAQEAGISRGTFYLHFRDKGELVARLMGHVTEELIQSTGTWLNNAENARPRDLQQALVGVVQTFKKHRAILEAVNDTAPHDHSVARLYHELIERISAQSRRSLSTVKRKGLSRPGASDEVADTLSGMIVTYCIRSVGRRSDAELDRLARALGYVATSAVFADPR
jgi:TetR/AcrR family transcriptional regulator, ethionamide resistance regulator